MGITLPLHAFSPEDGSLSNSGTPPPPSNGLGLHPLGGHLEGVLADVVEARGLRGVRGPPEEVVQQLHNVGERVPEDPWKGKRRGRQWQGT